MEKSSGFIDVLRYFPLAVFQADSDLNILFLNEQGKECTGYSDDDIERGLNGFDFFVPEEHDEVRDNIQRMTKCENKCFEQNLMRKDGSRFPVNIYAIPLMCDRNIAEFWGVAVDVTTRKAMEEKTRLYADQLQTLIDEKTRELRESETKFRFLTEQMNDIIWTLDMNLNTTYVSPSVQKILGFTPEERQKQTVMEQLTPDSLERTFRILSEEIQNEEKGDAPERCISVEVEYYHKDGSTRWCENVISGIRDEEGTLVGLHGVSRDVTERRKADDELLESIRWSRSIFNGVIDAVFIVDSELKYVDVNSAAIHLTSYSNDELLEKSMGDLHEKKHQEQFKHYFERVINGETITDHLEILRKDGENVPVEYRASKITIQDRTFLLLVANDLTLRKRYQERLEALYEIALKMAEANTIDSVADLCLSAVNDVLKYYLCSFSLVEDNYIRFRYQNSDNPIKELPLDSSGITVRAVNTGEIQIIKDVTKDVDYVQGLGEEVRSELAVPVKVDDNVRALINVESEEINAFSKEDIDHVATLAELVSNALQRLDTKEYLEKLVEKRTEELSEVNAQLLHLGEMKNQFINHVTHELRTPLTSIKGYLEILESMPLTDNLNSVERFFSILSRNTDRLTSLTNDLLEQQRIDSNKLRLDRSPTFLSDLIMQSIENISPMMQQKNQVATITYDETIPALTIDPIRIGQVLDNLLSNACKYSNMNSVISVKTENQADKVLVSISDEGIGLKPEDIAELFKPFPAITRPTSNENSTGLGLCICKGIIELHGGKIWAESEGNEKGSIFRFTLPKKR